MKETIYTDTKKDLADGSFLLANTVITMDKNGRLFYRRPPDSSDNRPAVFAFLREKLSFLWSFRNRYRLGSRKSLQ